MTNTSAPSPCPGAWCRPRALLWAVVALTTSLVLGACGGSGRSAAPTSTAASLSGSSTATGCGQAASGTSTLSAAIAGHTRIVIVHVPSGYTGSKKVALVLNMHGSGATALDQEAFSAMDVTADAGGVHRRLSAGRSSPTAPATTGTCLAPPSSGGGRSPRAPPTT